MVTRERIRPRRADVRREILDTARREFISHGYTRSSLQKIATAAGYTKGAVFSNFASKQELLLEVAREDFGLVRQELLQDYPTDAPWPLVADAVVALIISEVVNNEFIHCLVAEFGLEAAHDPLLRDAYATMRERQREDIMTLLAPLMASRHGFDAEVVDTMLRGILALTTGFIVERGVDDSALTPELMRTLLLAQMHVTPADVPSIENDRPES